MKKVIKKKKKKERREQLSQRTNPPLRARAKNYTKKTKQTKRANRTLAQMIKANLYIQNHTKKHAQTHSQKEKKEKIYIYINEESNQINKQIYR